MRAAGAYGGGVWTTEAGVLSGYGIDDDGPFLVVDERCEPSWRRHRLRPQGETIHLVASARWFCTGRYDLDSGRGDPCPLRRELPDGRFDQCFECRQVTGFNPAFYHASDISPQQQRHNAEPHVVYLAHFGCGLMKVGINYERRGLGRLLEQGARMAAIVGHFPDAYAARTLEALIARDFGVAETVRSARKRKLLGAPFDAEQARADLKSMIARIAAVRSDLSPVSELLRLDARYGDPELWVGTPQDLSDCDCPAIHGRCLGMIGDVLVVDGPAEQRGQHFMCSMGELSGRAIALTDKPGLNEVPGQMALPF